MLARTAAAAMLMLASCAPSRRVERARDAVRDASAVVSEAEPRIDAECVKAIEQTAAADEEVLAFCDPIVSEFTRLRERRQNLKAIVDRVDRVGEAGDPIKEAQLIRELRVEALAEELERTVRGFRQTLADWPTLKGAPAK